MPEVVVKPPPIPTGKPINATRGELVNMTGLCKVLGIGSVAVRTLIEKGMPVVEGMKRGKQYVFNTADCIEFKVKLEAEIIRQEYESMLPDDDPESKMTINEAKRRREVALAVKAELELANERKQVANIEDLTGLFRDALVNVRANLTSMSSRLAGVLSHQDEDVVAQLLDAEINDILENVSNYKGE